MKNTIYIIPGFGEICQLKRYADLAKLLETGKNKVIKVNPNWYKPLTEQVFTVPGNAVLVGFSFGAVLAYLIARNCPCRRVVFASLSPLRRFKFRELVGDFSKHMTKKQAIILARDIKNIEIELETLTTPHITLAGEDELDVGNVDLLVPRTGHRLNSKYIQAIASMVR